MDPHIERQTDVSRTEKHIIRHKDKQNEIVSDRQSIRHIDSQQTFRPTEGHIDRLTDRNT